MCDGHNFCWLNDIVFLGHLIWYFRQSLKTRLSKVQHLNSWLTFKKISYDNRLLLFDKHPHRCSHDSVVALNSSGSIYNGFKLKTYVFKYVAYPFILQSWFRSKTYNETRYVVDSYFVNWNVKLSDYSVGKTDYY